MIAKLIAHGPTRDQAIIKLAQACDEVEVWPVKTNAGFLARCLEAPDFIAGDLDTGFIERNLETLTAPAQPSPAALSAAASAAMVAAEADAGAVGEEPASPWRELVGFRLNRAPETSVRLFRDGQAVVADAAPQVPSRAVLVTDDEQIVVFEAGEAFAFSGHPPSAETAEGAGSDGQVRAPMPGKVTAVSVKAGARVAKGQTLLVLEAMKMEHALTAPFDGKVESLSVKLGDQVVEGVVLATLAAGDT
jgi:acetyl/propionyl-CoA carboxylase alpha subunit